MSAASYYANSRPEVAALLPASCRHVLEIGCGEGRFARHVRQRETYWGIEPACAAAEAARATLDRVFDGTFEDVATLLPEGFFDLVVCNDVIEHMRDHDAFLEAIHTKMTPGGVLVGSIPNMRFLPHLLRLVIQKDWPYQDAGVLDRTHLRFFTRKSFLRTLEEHCFQVEEIIGINSLTSGRSALAKFRWHLPLTLLQLCTMRTHRDTLYPQFAFRIRPRERLALNSGCHITKKSPSDR